MESSTQSSPVAYVRLLREEIIDWYKNADTKAQILLALDGAFLTVIAGGIVRDPEELKTIADQFGGETWVFLAALCVSLGGSICLALVCLWSRTSFHETKEYVKAVGVVPKSAEPSAPSLLWLWTTVQRLRQKVSLTRGRGFSPEIRTPSGESAPYPPEVMWFFGHIQHLDLALFQDQIRAMNADYEMRAHVIQLWRLSKRVSMKHFYVNLGFALAACALVSLLAAVMSYLVRISW